MTSKNQSNNQRDKIYKQNDKKRNDALYYTIEEIFSDNGASDWRIF